VTASARCSSPPPSPPLGEWVNGPGPTRGFVKNVFLSPQPQEIGPTKYLFGFAPLVNNNNPGWGGGVLGLGAKPALSFFSCYRRRFPAMPPGGGSRGGIAKVKIKLSQLDLRQLIQCCFGAPLGLRTGWRLNHFATDQACTSVRSSLGNTFCNSRMSLALPCMAWVQ
jgi:hypothetical protein